MPYAKAIDSVKLYVDLKKVADAIQLKTGTSAQFIFPNEMVAAINAISIDESTGGVEA